MNDNPFREKENQPGDYSLTQTLGKCKKFHDDLNKVSENFNHTWHFYKSGGWVEKVFDKKKALYYIVPALDSFRISMTIRESEKDFILAGETLQKYHDIISNARKYPEGYHIQFYISNSDEYLDARTFVEHIISMRG